MSAPDHVPAFGPWTFELSPDEARIAASRAALRRALAGGLIAGHLAPLAAFVLAITFTAILALTGLITRRHGEIALLSATAAFMIHRLWRLRRFALARRESAAAIEAIRAAGVLAVTVDETGIAAKGATASARWNFADGLELEDAGGMVYLWPRSGSPAVLPARVFASAAEASELIAFGRARTSRAGWLPKAENQEGQ